MANNYRLAKALERLRAQVNERFPNRDKRSDGWIGDAAHQSRGNQSDHNPWVRHQGIGVVTALDLTHDLKTGVDTWAMAEWMRRQADSRVKYIISNHRIVSSSVQPWRWRKYLGSNPHAHHVHVSVRSTPQHFDDSRDWDWVWHGIPASPPETSPDPDSPEIRPHLRQGSRGDDVRTVQRLLSVVPLDGIFGPRTDARVREFQRVEQLTIDGIVGPRTWAALDHIEKLPHTRSLSEPLP